MTVSQSSTNPNTDARVGGWVLKVGGEGRRRLRLAFRASSALAKSEDSEVPSLTRRSNFTINHICSHVLRMRSSIKEASA